MAPQEDIILYKYDLSPYSRKVTNYLNLRGIPYSIVQQPPTMPRPDLEAIGVRYRRMPIMSLGRDVYCDSMLILQKLEELYPSTPDHPTLGANKGADKALQYLLEKWTSDVTFFRAVATIPPEFPALNDPGFTKDRAELWGGEWSQEHQQKMRAAALKDMEESLEFLETLMEDGRSWALGEEGPTLSDIHAVWSVDWLLETIPGSLPEDMTKRYPKALAWRNRYNEACAAAKAKSSVQEIEGSEATLRISKAGFAEAEGQVDGKDPVAEASRLEKGSKVDVWPSDTESGVKYRDIGNLVALSSSEVVLEAKMASNQGNIRIHAPRWNYKVRPSSDSLENGS